MKYVFPQYSNDAGIIPTSWGPEVPIIDVEVLSTYTLPGAMILLSNGKWVVLNLWSSKTKVMFNIGDMAIEYLECEDSLAEGRPKIRIPSDSIVGVISHPRLTMFASAVDNNNIKLETHQIYAKFDWKNPNPDLWYEISTGEENAILLPEHISAISFYNYCNPYKWMTTRDVENLTNVVFPNSGEWARIAHYSLENAIDLRSIGYFSQKRESNINPLW